MTEKILFLGNSITKHAKVSYWYGDWGMAASKRDNDYVHVFTKSMRDKGCVVSFEVFNFYAWEGMEHDRAETFQLVESKLSADVTLVVCQLGENIRSVHGLYEDYREMLEFIHAHSPLARIMVISPFGRMPEVAEAEKKAADHCGAVFVDCSDLWSSADWMCPDGYTVEGEDGSIHRVEHVG